MLEKAMQVMRTFDLLGTFRKSAPARSADLTEHGSPAASSHTGHYGVRSVRK
jgi:hypothetical protein